MTAYYGKVLDDVVVSPTAPADPYPDQLWWNSTNNGLYRWQTPDWVPQGTSAVIGWDDIEGKPATFPPTVPISQANVSGLIPALAEKAPLASPVFTGVPQTPTAAPGTNSTQIASTAFVGAAVGTAIGGIDVDVSWDDVSGKPSTFPPTVPIAWADVSGTPSTYPPTLPIAQAGVTNLITDLSGKAPIIHTHTQADVTNLETDLAGKAPTVHTHTTAQVTGLDTALANKADTATLANYLPLAGGTTTGQITIPLGSSANPSINFTGYPNHGLLATASFVLISESSSAKVAFGGTANRFYNFNRFEYGTAAIPSFQWTSDTDTGMWGAAATINFATSGVNRMSITDTGVSTTVKLTPVNTTAASAGFNIGYGGTVPTTPVDGDVWMSGTALQYRANAATCTLINNVSAQSMTGNKTFTGTTSLAVTNLTAKLTTFASAAGAAGINLPPGAAPSAPANGDLWSTTAGFYGQVNGATVGPFGAGGGGGVPSDTNPVINGTAAPGVLTTYSRGDHVHPSDTAKLDLAGGIMTGAITMKVGSAAAPAILTSGGGTDSGIYGNGAAVVMVTSGTARLTVGSGAITGTIVYRQPNGAVGAPAYSFTSDTDAGLYLSAAGDMRLAMGGADVVKWLDDKSTTFFGKGFFPVTATLAPINLAPGVTPSGLSDGDVWIHSTSGLTYRNAAATVITASLGTVQTFNGAKTFSVKPTFATSITTQASCNLPHGVAPTTGIADGDMWSTSAGGVYARINGVSKNLSIHVGTTAPASPITNDLWLDIT